WVAYSQTAVHGPRYPDQLVPPRLADTLLFATTVQSARPSFWVQGTCECFRSPDAQGPAIDRTRSSASQDSLYPAPRDGEGLVPFSSTKHLPPFHPTSQESGCSDASRVIPGKMATESEPALRPNPEIGNPECHLCLPSRPQPNHIGSTMIVIPLRWIKFLKTIPDMLALPMESNR